MDNLVLTRFAIEASRTLPGTVLEEFRQESSQRFRLTFGFGPTASALVVSMRPEVPWIGRPQHRWDGPRWSPDEFTVLASGALTGCRLESVSKPAVDRALVFQFTDGRGLAVELANHGANLVLLDPGGTIAGCLRRPKSGAGRLDPGGAYRTRAIPRGQLDPFLADAAEVDAFVSASQERGEPPFETLRRHVFGLGTAAAALVVAEAESAGRTAGGILRARLDALMRGEAEPGIVGPSEVAVALARGEFTPATFRLLPWAPATVSEGTVWSRGGSIAETSGIYHEALEAAARLAGHVAGVGTIVREEARRARNAAERARESLRAFENPDRFRRQGEALLAGLSVARRSGGRIVVPDPYEASGATIEIEAPADRSLTHVADDLFRKHRRARRGIEATGERIQALAGRLGRLEALAARQATARTEQDVLSLEQDLRGMGLAVGLAPPTRAGRQAARAAGPKVEGVRMFTSADGHSILVGRTARDNDRLTFKLAGPDDVWLHAAGLPGAHVIVRLPNSVRTIPERTLRQAAELAAWFSDAHREGSTDVHWTRRKNVRRARGGSAGVVVLKRFETVRVRPNPPPPEEGVGQKEDQ